MVDLSGVSALIAGGAGHVGEGIVRAFLERGAHVAVPSRDAAKNAALKERMGKLAAKLLAVTGDISHPGEAPRIRDEIERAQGPITAVVAAVGGWWQGPPLVQVERSEWQRVFDNNVTSHLILAQALLPLLASRAGASYTLINGTACETPIAGSGLASIAAAAQAMMARVLVEEHKGTQVRINVLVLGNIHTRKVPNAPPESLEPGDVGAFCAYLASSEGRMVSGGLHHLLERPAIGTSAR